MKHDINNKIHDNYIKGVVRTNMYRPRVEEDKTKYSRKRKHKNVNYE